jgi:hypothetical protein
VRFLGIKGEDLPRHFTICNYESGNRFRSQATHGFEPMAAVGSPKAVPRRRYHNDWVEKSSSLIDDVSQPFVIGIGQVALKGSWLDGIAAFTYPRHTGQNY